MKFYCNNCNGITYIDVPDIDYVGCGHCDAVIPVPKRRYDSGVVIADEYVLLEHVGTGGMGLVYKAHQISLERTVAIKILKDSFSNDQTFIDKFISEARTAASLRHSNIVQSYAIGNDKNTYFIAMEFINGQTLSELMLRQHQFSEKETADIATAVLEGLNYAWNEKQLMHRDIKPDNIMIDKAGNVKLMDMGLSCSFQDLTEHEEIIGTPQYIAPDLFLSGTMDFRSDQYSLGATMYHMMAGCFPFDGDTPEETAMMHIEKVLVPIQAKNSKISNELSSLINKMMAKTPDLRFQSTSSLITKLNKISSAKKTIVKQSRVNKTKSSNSIFETVTNIFETATGMATAHFRREPYSNVNDILKYSCIAIIILAIIIGALFLIN